MKYTTSEPTEELCVALAHTVISDCFARKEVLVSRRCYGYDHHHQRSQASPAIAAYSFSAAATR